MFTLGNVHKAPKREPQRVEHPKFHIVNDDKFKHNLTKLAPLDAQAATSEAFQDFVKNRKDHLSRKVEHDSMKGGQKPNKYHQAYGGTIKEGLPILKNVHKR